MHDDQAIAVAAHVGQDRGEAAGVGGRHDLALDGSERPQIGDHRGQVFLRHVLVVVRRHQDERTAVFVDAVADRARHLAVGEVALKRVGRS